MKWATYRQHTTTRTGVLVGQTLYGLDSEIALQDLLALGPEVVAAAAREATRGSIGADLGEVELLPPVQRPGSVRDSLCFLDHMRGCRRALGTPDPDELPEVWQRIPAFYFTNPASLYGAHDDVPISPGAKWFDFEAEIAVVIGRTGGNLTPAQAMDHVAGYTLFCDWTARDLQVDDLALGIGQAKGKDGALTLGPFLVTPDEVDAAGLELHASLNGTELASGSSRSMHWSFGELISYISRGTRLRAGDVIGSGTIPGGCLLERVKTTPEAYSGWLAAGDSVTLHSPQLGTTTSRIVDGPAVSVLRTGY